MSRQYACALVAVIALVVPATADAQTFKVATWNVRGAQGVDDFPSNDPTLVQGSDCTTNAWGGTMGPAGEGLLPATGLLPQLLRQTIRDDPKVIALVVNEAWNCGRPTSIVQVLNDNGGNWKVAKSPVSSTGAVGGTGILARYGFPPGITTLAMKSLGKNAAGTEEKWIVHIPVCLNSGCTQQVDVFGSHWWGAGGATTAQTTLDFMTVRAGGKPHVTLGDWNQALDKLPNQPSYCAGALEPHELDTLTNAGYIDGWRQLHPTLPGYSGMLNDRDCGEPDGSPYKRIDYGFSLGLTPVSATMFGIPAFSTDAASDHAGLVFEYQIPGASDNPPVVSISSPPDGALVWSNVSVSVSATDDVGLDRVDLKRDGAIIHTWFSPFTLPLTYSWDSTTVGDGTHTLEAVARDTAGQTRSNLHQVTVDNIPPSATGFWTGLVNAIENGTTLQKTQGCSSCFDGGAYSVNTITSGDGAAGFTAPALTRLYAGLGTDRTTSTDPTKINFAFSLWPDGGWEVRELGSYKREGTYVAGDVFKVAIESGSVKYYKNSALVYTSLTPATYPLGLDASIAPVNATISAPSLTGGGAGNGGAENVNWTNVLNATATSNTLEKISGCGSCADGGGISQQTIASGEGFIEFTPSVGHRFYAGLGKDRTSNTDGVNIDYAFTFWTTGTWDIRERGVYKFEGDYAAGDVFRVSVEGGVVKYYQNNVVVYMSATPPTYPLGFDTTMYTIGSKVSNAKIQP
jgi:hypothetical protein